MPQLVDIAIALHDKATNLITVLNELGFHSEAVAHSLEDLTDTIEELNEYVELSEDIDDDPDGHSYENIVDPRA